VTVFGENLNSVAEPRITVTVVITRLDNDSSLTSYENETDSQVKEHHYYRAVESGHGVAKLLPAFYWLLHLKKI